MERRTKPKMPLKTENISTLALTTDETMAYRTKKCMFVKVCIGADSTKLNMAVI